MSASTSVDHATMREMNVSLVLNMLRLHAPVSRAGLAAQTGLNKATVSNVIKELLAHHLIREMGVDTTAAEIGRPAINLELNPEAGFILSLEIGVDFVSTIALDFTLGIVARRYENTVGLRDQRAILARAFDLVKEIYRQVKRRGTVLGLGIGVPGLVDMSTGTLLFAPNLGWRDVPLRSLFEHEFDLPTFVANEANMAALGESYFGQQHNNDFLLYVNSGVGLGGGIVLNGQLLTGATGFAGEVGHMTVVPDGLRCTCGNTGCWETVASQRAVFRYIREAVTAGRQSLLVDVTGGDLQALNVPVVVQAAYDGDKLAREALETVGVWLGIGFANLMNVINPQRVVFGGSLTLAHEFLLPVMHDEIARRALPWVRAKAEVTLATHGADAPAVGAAAMVHREILNSPMEWLKHVRTA